MTSIAAGNQNHESDETITSHSELEDNDDGSQMMLGAEIRALQYCLHRRLHSARLSPLLGFIASPGAQEYTTSKHYAKGMALHAIF